MNCNKSSISNSFWDIWKDFHENIVDNTLPQKDGSIWVEYYNNLFGLTIPDSQKSEDSIMLGKFIKDIE